MNIKELKEKIQDLPDDMEVILSSDEEGNSYLPLRVVDDNCVFEKNDGYFVSLDFSAKNNGFDSEEEYDEFKKKNPRVLTLYP